MTHVMQAGATDIDTRTEPVLELLGITKRYPGVTALSNVDLTVTVGEVHALVGENGAGKSTLIGIASGATPADEGQVRIAGQLVERPSPEAARRLGLSVVYQHTALLDDLTVSENVALSLAAAGRARPPDLSRWVEKRLAAVDADFHPQERVGTLSVAQRQQLEIARALALEAKVLLLDEPTDGLTQRETDALFAQVRRVAAAGTAVVYISHRLAEVREIADRITVLRDGHTQGTFPAHGLTEQRILTLMVGRDIGHTFPDRAVSDDASRDRPVMTVRGLSGARFHDVSFVLRAGEILGFAGIDGNGQREAMRALAGLEQNSGVVEVRGSAARLRTVQSALSHGLVYLPGDRHAEGVFLSLSVRENLSALILPQLSRVGVMSPARENAAAHRLAGDLNVKTPTIATQVGALSGGNQQKVALGRSLAAEPTVLLADDPTRGVDMGARVELYERIAAVADAGGSVVLLSSDALELAGICDRVLVFSRGRIVGELTGADLTEERITGAAVTAVSKVSDADEGAPPVRGRPAWGSALRRFLSGDYLPAAALLAVIIGLAIYTNGQNSFFVTDRNLIGVFGLAAILGLVSLGQLMLLMAGGIDLSSGSVMSLVVVIMSYYAQDGQTTEKLLLGAVVAVVAGVLVGLANALLVYLLRLNAVVATLGTSIVVGGIALLMRSQPGGGIRSGLSPALKSAIGPVPWIFVVVVVLTVVAELWLRRSRGGLRIRAIGSDPVKAAKLGIRVTRVGTAAFASSSVGAALAGLLLSVAVGVGDATSGQSYTLACISAVVLGGASIYGGRGSFVAALAGAVLFVEITSSTSFLGLTQQWQYWLPGLLILAGATVFSNLRGQRGVTL